VTATSVPDARARDVAIINARIDRLPKWGLGTSAFVILGACYLLAFYDIAVIGVAMPSIAQGLHLTSAETTLPVSVNLIGYIVGALGLGNLADRFGRRPVLAAVVVILAVSALATAFSWDVMSLTVFRFIAGIGTGALITLAATFIGELSPAKSRGRYLARNAFWTTVGNPIPALIALWLVHANVGSGWRILLAVPVVMALALFFFRDSMLPESPRWLASHGDLARARRLADQMERRVGAGSLPADEEAAAVELAAAAHETTFRAVELLRRPFVGRLAVVFGMWFFFYFGMYAFLAWGPTIYEHLGATTSAADLMTALGFAGGIIVAGLQILWIDRIERKLTIIGGFTVFVIGFAVMALSAGEVMVTIGSVIASTGAIAGMIPAYAYTAEIFPTRARASAMGLGDGLGHLGGAIQSFVVVGVLSSAGPRPALWLMAAALFIAVLFMLLAVRTTGRSLTELTATDTGKAPAETAAA